MIEKSRTLNPRQTVRPIAEEKFPERFEEFSEIEELSLDENRFPLTMRDQTEFWSKAIAWLYGFGYAGEKKLPDIIDERFDDAFQHFNLNLDKYDERATSHGMLLHGVYKPDKAKQLLVLRMLGVEQMQDLYDFFGVLRRGGVHGTSSPAFDTVLNAQRTKRERFLIEHRKEYPLVDKLFGELESEYGLKANDIFKPGRIPTLKLARDKKYSMEQFLVYLKRILSGSVTAQELGRSGPTRGMHWEFIRDRLNPEVVALVEERRAKRGGKDL